MIFKRSICLLVGMVLVMSLAACGAGTATVPSGTTLPSSSAAPTDPPPTDPNVPDEPDTPVVPAPPEKPDEPEKPEEPAKTEGGLGLAHLRTQPKAEALEALYHQVVAACDTMETTLSVEGLTYEELALVLHCYRQDHPESFWLSRQFSYSSLDNRITELEILYESTDADAVEFDRQLLEDTVDSMLELLTGDMGDYEKALTLYDALIDRCAYILDAPNAHNLYGALVDGQAVCEGYALAYQYLLLRAGIPAMYVTGYSSGEAHAWNAMELDGNWYYADPTWDDPKNNNGMFRYYGYFAMTTEMMWWDHDPDWNSLELPEAGSLDCNYYYRADRIATVFDRQQVMQWMAEGDTLRIYVEGDPDAYLQALRQNIDSMVLEADLPWYGYVYTVNGREIIFKFR